MAQQSICLVMIVRDEQSVIERCLESVKGVIDSWCIVDTGSTDETIPLVYEAMKGIPGVLRRRPWIDFSYNRTESLEIARKTVTPTPDYFLLVDADHVIGTEPEFVWPELTADSYDLELRYADIVYPSKRLVKASLPWRYEGVLHEYITYAEAQTEGTLRGLWQTVLHDGARAHDPLTYRKDALVLERETMDHPDDARSMFYLAQSWRDAGEPELAIQRYMRRVEMGGWSEEVFIALYQIARIKEARGDPWQEVQHAYLVAHEHSPDRAEPLYRLGSHYRHARAFHLADLFLYRAAALWQPVGNRLFVEKALYEFHVPLEYAAVLYWLDRHEEAVAINEGLLCRDDLPADLHTLVTQNLDYSKQKVT